MKRTSFSVSVILMALAAPAHAAWSVYGNPVAPSATTQSDPGIAPDGAGGAYVAFRSAAGFLTLQRLTAQGDVAAGWPAGGVTTPLRGGGPSGFPAQVFTDVAGGALLLASVAANGDALAARVSEFGATRAGWPLSFATATPGTHVISGLPSGALGQDLAAMASTGDSAGTTYLHATGATIDAAVSFAPPPAGDFVTPLAVAPRPGGGLLIGYTKSVPSISDPNLDVFVQGFSPSGAGDWLGGTGHGLTVASGTLNQIDPAMCPDDVGGLWTAWQVASASPATNGISIAHVTASSGTILPAVNGARMVNSLTPRYRVRLVRDGAGGVWASWQDARFGAYDLYFTHVLANLTLPAGYPGNGKPLAAAPGVQGELTMIEDGHGGFFAAWSDERFGTADIWGLHVLANGQPAPGWPAGGLPLISNVGVQRRPALARVQDGRAIVVAEDLGGEVAQVVAAEVAPYDPVAVPPHAGGTLTLGRPVPNPSRGEARIAFALASAAAVRLTVVDLAGRDVAGEDLGRYSAGIHTRSIALPAGLDSGLYFLRLRTDSGLEASRRLTVVR